VYPNNKKAGVNMTSKKLIGIFSLISIFLINISALETELFAGKRIPAVVNDDNVNVRDNVGLSSNVMTKLNRGEYLYIIGQTTEKQQIGEWNSLWYKASRLSTEEEFWIYGEFVTFLEEPSLCGEDDPFFCYIDASQITVSDGVYKLSEVIESSSAETLSFSEYYTTVSYELVAYNNTIALYLDGDLQLFSNITNIFNDSWGRTHRIPFMDWARSLKDGRDNYYAIYREYRGMMDADTFGIEFNEQTLALETSSWHSFGPDTKGVMTFTKDFTGKISIKEGEPDYPKDYFINREESIALYTEPDLKASLVDVKIPGWGGKEKFSNWVGYSQAIREYGESSETLNSNELPLFTVVERMAGNASSDNNKRWYKVTYNGISGYIMVDPRTLTTSKEYLGNLYSLYEY
jgi:hypothetical protein